MAQISDTTSASKIMVSFTVSPSKTLKLLGTSAEKAATSSPVALRMIPPTPHGQVSEEGSYEASVNTYHGNFHPTLTVRGLADSNIFEI